MKNRLQALSLLDRALGAITDDELEALIASLPEDHVGAIDQIAGAREDGFDDPAARTLGIRAAVARGRMSGAMEQIATVVTDPCLADCIKVLGSASDNPSEAQLQEVIPGLVERHGVATLRLTLAASIAGEAAASVVLTRLLKSDEVLALPPAPEPAAPVVLVNAVDHETRARRKAAKEHKQAGSRQRREQQLKAKNRI